MDTAERLIALLPPSPTAAPIRFNPVTPDTSTYQLNSWDAALLNGDLSESWTLETPTEFEIGDEFLIIVGGNAGIAGVQLVGSGDATVNEVSSLSLFDGAEDFGGPFCVRVLAMSSTSWYVTGTVGTDVGSSMQVNGKLSLDSGLFLTQYAQKSSAYQLTGNDLIVKHLTGNNISFTLDALEAGQTYFLINNNGTPLPLLGITGSNGPTVMPPRSAGIISSPGNSEWDWLATYNIPAPSLSNIAATETFVSGTAAQLSQTAQKATLFVTVTGAGTLTLAMGPDDTVATITPYSAIVVVAGQTMEIPVPAGWFLNFTLGAGATISTKSLTE